MGLTVPNILRAWKGTHKVAIVRANRYIVDHTDFLIALCVAPCQQRKRSSGICKEEGGKRFHQVTALPHNDFEKKSLLLYSFHIHKLLYNLASIPGLPCQWVRLSVCNDNLCNILIFKSLFHKTGTLPSFHGFWDTLFSLGFHSHSIFPDTGSRMGKFSTKIYKNLHSGSKWILYDIGIPNLERMVPFMRISLNN